MVGEHAPDTDNVAYIDEYPHLAEKVRLRRLGQLSLVPSSLENVIVFPDREEGEI